MKYLLFVVLLHPWFAQAQQIFWAKQSSATTVSLISPYVVADAAGNSYVAGSYDAASITFGSTMLINSGTFDIYLVKYSPSGAVLWAKTFGDSLNEIIFSIGIDPWGNVFLYGYYASDHVTFGSTTLTNPGATFLVKLNSSGDPIWAKDQQMLYGTSYNGGNLMAVDNSGNVAIAGSFDGSATIGSFYFSGPVGSNIIYTAKYDSSGNVLWAKTSSGTPGMDCLPTALTVDWSGNVFLAGTCTAPGISFDSITINNTTIDEIFLVKYDSSGVAVWGKGIADSNYSSSISGIGSDYSGNTYVTGTFGLGNITIGSTALVNVGFHAIGQNIFVAKYDRSGNVLWAKSAGGFGGNAGVNAIVVDNSGNALIGGILDDTTTFGSIVAPNWGYFVTKYNSDGNVIWVKNGAARNEAEVSGIARDGSGQIYICGRYLLSFMLDTCTLTGGGDPFYMFTAKLADASEGVSATEQAGNGILVYPNPAHSVLNIASPEKITSVTVGNIVGQTLHIENPNAEKAEINIADLPVGIYLVKINDTVRKFVKE